MEVRNKIPNFSEDDIIRFWSKVKITANDNCCWEWGHSIGGNGYGHFKIKNVLINSHRIAFYLFNGVDPFKMHVCHTCDNRKCCNPKHLFLGTVTDNMRDMMKKGRKVIVSGEKHWAVRNSRLLKRGDNHYSRIKPEVLARGERHGMVKLSENDVLSIRNEFSTSKISLNALARKYNVSHTLVGYIIKRKLWVHI